VKDKDAIFALKCDRHGQGRVYAQFISRDYLGDGNRALTYRLDSAAPVESEWEYKSRFAILWDEQLLITPMADASRLVIRAQTSGGDNVDAAFDITGAREAIKQTYRLCVA